VGTYAGEVHLYDFPSLRTVSISNRHGRVWCVQYDPVRDRLVRTRTHPTHPKALPCISYDGFGATTR
jgi:hypothetical protein